MLHNSISDAKLTVTNFGRNENGEFVFVVEQPYVNGTQLTQDEIVEYMKSMGFSTYNNKNTEFSNGEILINDLHDENVIRRSDGSITIIDADFRLNTANYGLNGKRTTTQSSNLQESTSSRSIESIRAEYNSLRSNVSRAIDPDTMEPMLMYHVNKHGELEGNAFRRGTNGGKSGNGIYFSASPQRKFVNMPGSKTFEVFLNIRNPLTRAEANRLEKETGESIYKRVRTLILGTDTDKIDELVAKYSYDSTMYLGAFNEVTVINPNQVKSATDNEGSYSTKVDRIDKFVDHYGGAVLTTPESRLEGDITSRQNSALAQQAVQHLREAGLDVREITQEVIDKYFGEGSQAAQEAIHYLNSDYSEDVSDLQTEIEQKKYNKAGTDVVILENDNRIFLIDHSSHKEYQVHREEGRHGFGIRSVYDLNNLTEDNIKEIIRNVASGYNYSTESIRRLLQNIQVKEEYSNSAFIDAELKGITDSNTELYGKDRRKWPTGGYGHRGQNNNDGKSSIGTERSLGQKAQEFRTPQGEVYGFVTQVTAKTTLKLQTA